MHDPDFDPYLPLKAAVGFSKAGPIEGNPWLTIWVRPRATIRGIVDTDPARSLRLLAILAGISSALKSSLRSGGVTLNLTSILALAAVAGTIGGLIGNWFMGVLLRWSGGWLGGTATVDECRSAIAWGSMADIANLGWMLLTLAVLGLGAYQENVPGDVGPDMALLRLVVRLPQQVLSLWSAVLIVRAVAEVHRFSSWRSLGAFVLATPIILGVLILVAMMALAVVSASGLRS